MQLGYATNKEEENLEVVIIILYVLILLSIVTSPLFPYFWG
jgi:hypothetical protein